MTKRATRVEPSASLAVPFISFGTLVVLAILGILGIVTAILIAVSPVFQMMAYVVISAAVVYFLAKVIGVKKKHKPIYFLCSFFALFTLMIVAPVFLSFFPANTYAVVGSAALAQATAGVGATNSQMVLSIMPVIAAGTIVGIAAGRAKTTIQLIILSAVAVLISIFLVFALLVI